MDIDPTDLEGYRRLETRAAAREAFQRCLARAQRSLRLFDDTGEFWGLAEHGFAESLRALLTRNRDNSTAIVVHDTRFIVRDCPRLMALLAIHGDRLRIVPADPALRSYERGFVVIDDTVVLRRPSFEQPRVFVDFDETAVSAASRLLDELFESAGPALSVSVAGL